MDIEQTQKINRLAKELLVHRIVESSDEAIVKAEEMIVGKSGMVQRESAENRDREVQFLYNGLKDLSADVTTLAGDLAKMREGLDSVRRDVSSMVQQFSQLAAAQRQAAQAAEAKPVQKAAPAPAPAAAPSGAGSGGVSRGVSHSSSERENFSQDDVSIDKIFYFGKK